MNKYRTQKETHTETRTLKHARGSDDGSSWDPRRPVAPASPRRIGREESATYSADDRTRQGDVAGGGSSDEVVMVTKLSVDAEQAVTCAFVEHGTRRYAVGSALRTTGCQGTYLLTSGLKVRGE